MELNSEEIQILRARAHNLNPVVIIGSKGLSPNVIKEIDTALRSHELVKIKVAQGDRVYRAQLLTEICTQLNATIIQHIGKILVIYRSNVESEDPALLELLSRMGLLNE